MNEAVLSIMIILKLSGGYPTLSFKIIIIFKIFRLTTS